MRLNKASVAFGSLPIWLWNIHGISIATKVMVYGAVIIATPLYGCETWTVYWRHITQLDRFHMSCLRKTADIIWQDRIPNQEVLKNVKYRELNHFLCRPNFVGVDMCVA